MPIQAPQWTEFLSCPVCYNEFDENVRRPISLGCGHTVCKMCLGQLHRKHCPFDQAEITQDIDELPANYALLQLVGSEPPEEEERLPLSIVNGYMRHYAASKSCVEDLAWYLKPLGKAGSSANSSSGATAATSCVLSKPMQRKLVALVNCQLVEEEGRSRAMRAARSLGERTVTELILQHQNQQQLSANLWAAVRARGCQFLGPAMQEETLKLVLLALEDGAALSRKVLVMFVVQKLEQQFPQASKTSVGHVVQLLYRASCFMVTKRDEESSLMQLKDEFRNYDALRREHDAQIVQIAMEAGLRISPEQWSSLLYGDLNHKSHMQSIIDKLQTPASFATSIQELTIALQRSGDPGQLSKLTKHLDQLAAIDPNPDAGTPSWSELEKAMIAVKTVVQGLVDFAQNHNLNKKALEQQTQNIKYKTSMCRDISQKGGCPRGSSCTFAHSEEELERYRAKSRRMLSALNRQLSSQNKASERAKTDKLIARGVHDDGLSKEDRHDLMELQQQIASRNKQELAATSQRPSGNVSVPAVPSSTQLPDSDRDTASSASAASSAWSFREEDGGSYSADIPAIHKLPVRYSDYLLPTTGLPYRSSQVPSTPSRTSAASDLYDLRTSRQQGTSQDINPTVNIQEPSKSSRYVHHSGIGSTRHTTPIPVYSYQYSNNVTAHGVRDLPDSPVSKPRVKDNATIWDVCDGPLLEQYGYNQDPVKRIVGAGKPSIKTAIVDSLNISNTLSQDIALGELCERKQEILHQLRGFNHSDGKNPWDRNQSLTKTVTSLWTIPSDSISKQSADRNPEDIVCYNPWTSQAPFCLIRPVKESNTNYTMTYIKAHVRHMSVDDHYGIIQDKPMGTHELSEFKKMSLEDLEQTLQKVKQEDEHAGSCHYERGQKIQLEMDRRHQQLQPDWDVHIGDYGASKLKLRVQSDPHSYRSDDQQEMMRYYQTLPLGAHSDIRSHQGHSPIIKSSRTPFKSTGPIQVNAGPSPETNPVTLTQDCQVAPSFQSSPTEGYHYMGQDSYPVATVTAVSLWPPKMTTSKDSQPQQVANESDIEQQLKNELADVSQEIQKQVLNKNARDIVLLEQVTHALDPSVSSSSPHNLINIYETRSDAAIAKQLQQQELEKCRSNYVHQHNQASSKYTQS